MKINCERNFQGAWVCSAIIDGFLLRRIYMGYTKAYAIRDFRKNPPK